jgi:hypothetical protein
MEEITASEMFVVSLSGFRGKNKEFVVKEVSLVGADKDGNRISQTFHILPPYPEDELPEKVKKTNQWVGRNYTQGYGWEYGTIPYSEWEERVRQTCSTIPKAVVFAKGLEQVKLLRSFIPSEEHEVKDLERLVYYSFATMLRLDAKNNTSCGIPGHGRANCTLNKSTVYLNWLLEEKAEEERKKKKREQKEQEEKRREEQERAEQEREEWEELEIIESLARMCINMGSSPAGKVFVVVRK